MNQDKAPSINSLQLLVMSQAEKKGFGTNKSDVDVAEKIALIHSEVSEAYDAYRHNNFVGKDGFSEELGDIVLRVIHLAGCFDINLEHKILAKLESNGLREWDWDNLNEKHN